MSERLFQCFQQNFKNVQINVHIHSFRISKCSKNDPERIRLQQLLFVPVSSALFFFALLHLKLKHHKFSENPSIVYCVSNAVLAYWKLSSARLIYWYEVH